MPPFDNEGDVLDAEWMLPTTRSTPAQSLARIGCLCAGMPDLFSALLAVLGAHQNVSREILAMAIKQCRPDLADLSRDDVVGLLVSIWNGGRQGFDAVLRSRRRGGGERAAAALPWQAG
jgi:hypothetical protein